MTIIELLVKMEENMSFFLFDYIEAVVYDVIPITIIVITIIV